MKKIIAIALALLMIFCTCACAAKPHDIESDDKQSAVLDKNKFNLAAKGNASPFDHMSEAALRRELRPYLEAWYEFCYRGMWWFSLKLSDAKETVETEDGSIYVKAADYNTAEELSQYLSQWLAPSAFNDILSVQTYEDETGLYLLQISTGWYAEPDFNDCEFITTKNGKYYVSFNEKIKLTEEETATHVLVFEIVNGKLLVCDSLTIADGLEMVVEKKLKSDITPELMTDFEFKEFVTLMLNRYCQLIGYVSFSEASISRCTEEWINAEEGVDCVAKVLVNGKYHYVLIGVDINGRYDVIRIQEV